jgi:hypothetical protein
MKGGGWVSGRRGHRKLAAEVVYEGADCGDCISGSAGLGHCARLIDMWREVVGEA